MPFSPRHKPSRPPAPGPSPVAVLLVAEARAAAARGSFEDALRLCDQALADSPDDISALSVAAELCLRRGLKEKALPLLERATRLQPDQGGLQYMYGIALFQMDRAETAVRALERATRLQPGNGQAWSALGASHQKLGHLQDALAAYEQATTLEPSDADIWVNRSAAALRLKDWPGAEQACARALDISPGHRRALTYQAIALTELGRRDEAAEILDFDSLMRRVDLAGHMTAGELEGLNKALVAHIEARPDLTYEPILKATKGGSQTQNLLAGPAGPVAQLEAEVRRAVDAYITDADPARHPYLAFAPRKWRLIMWGTLLRRQGRQAPHIHPGAWLSGVY
ncbi:MAG: tetratricopeptide repeat protein, partial [Rhodospirillales bacterium]